eukprot:scaffold197_cov129-Cylindrotheca_fusiformis.AAC.1
METAERQDEKAGLLLDKLRLEDDLKSLENDIYSPPPKTSPQHLSLSLNNEGGDGDDDTTLSSLRTPSARPLLEKFQSLNESWSSVKSRTSSISSQHRLTPRHLRTPRSTFSPSERSEEDDLSIGASTISTISQESVFDRLYRQGTNHQRQRRQSSISKRRLSNSGIPTPTQQHAHQHRKQQKRGSSVRSSVSSRSEPTTAQRKSKIPTPQASVKKRNRIASGKTASSPKSQPSDDSVFHRLYRNEKRSETLWSAPPAPKIGTQSKRKNKTSMGSRLVAPASRTKKKQTKSASSVTSEKENASSSLSTPLSSAVATLNTASASSIDQSHKSRTQGPANTTPDKAQAPERTLDEDIEDFLKTELAPTPRRRNAPSSYQHARSEGQPTEGQSRRLDWTPGWSDGQHQAAEHLAIVKERSPPPSAVSTVTHLEDDDRTTSSKGSYGFFTLDQSSSSLLQSAALQQQLTQRTSKAIACTKLQSWWRGRQMQLRLARLLVEEWHVDYPKFGMTKPSQRLQALEKSRTKATEMEMHRSSDGSVLKARTSLLLSIRAHLSGSYYPRLSAKLNDGLVMRGVLSKASLELQGDLYLKSSCTIQRWWRRITKRVEPRQVTPIIQHQPGPAEVAPTGSPMDTPSLLAELNNPDDDDEDYDLLVSPVSVEQPKGKTIDEDEWKLQSPSPTLLFREDTADTEESPPEPVETPAKQQPQQQQTEVSDERHRAATVIQNGFRMSSLTSAIERSPHPQTHFRNALASPNFPRWADDDPWLAKEPSDGFQRWAPTDLIERKSASLAIHNIVRAYLHGLRKYRRGKKATLIQATFRRHSCMKQYQMQLWAAMTIQFAWTNYSYRMTLRQKATKIQGVFKMTTVQNKFQIIKFAAIVVQTQWRRWKAMHRYSRTKFLALWLQRACVRGQCHRRRFVALRSAVTSVQRLFRIRRTRKLYQLQTLQATRIQAAWKMSVALRHRLLALYFAAKIQSNFRTHLASTSYQYKRKQVERIQRRWRQYSAWTFYCLQVQSVTSIQAQWRRILSQRSWNRHLDAVVAIQRIYRMYDAKKNTNRAISAVVRLQTEWRRHHAQSVFSRKRRCAIKLQTQWRMQAEQKAWYDTRIAIIALQSLCRAFIHSKSFQLLHRSAVAIQTQWRSFHQKAAFQLKLQHILCVQSVVRQMIATRNWTKTRGAVLLCQRLVRGSIARSAYQQRRKRCIRIQTVYRRHHAIENWKSQVNAVLMIQTGCRMALAMGHLRHSISMVTTLQRAVRGHQQRAKYNSIREALSRIQGAIRCWQQQRIYSTMKGAATLIQAVARRNTARNRHTKALSSVVLLQSASRRYTCRSKFEALRNATCLIQSCFRGYYHRCNYLRFLRSVLILQRVGRGTLVRHVHEVKSEAGLLIQRCWRGAKARAFAAQRLSSVFLIQRFWFKRREEKIRARELHDLVLIQSAWRSSIWRGRYKASRSSVLRIQSSLRRYLAQKRLHEVVEAAISIQRIWRGHSKRMYFVVKANKAKRASILIQATWRMQSVYKLYNALQGAAIIVQAYCRGRLTRNANFHATIACVSIQSSWRASKARENYLVARASATIIQSFLRGVAARNSIVGLHLLAIRIQRKWRSGRDRIEGLLRLSRKKEEMNLAATILQAHWRMWLSRTRHHACIGAAISLQTFWRSFLARKHYSIVRSSCFIIQCHVRRALVRENIAMWHVAAVEIQKTWRGHRNAENFKAELSAKKKQNEAAGRIQSVWRMTKVKKKYASALVASQLIQKHWRSSLARDRFLLFRTSALMIQSVIRGYLCRRRLGSMHSSAAGIQKLWRDHCYVQKLKLSLQTHAATQIQRFWRKERAIMAFRSVVMSTVLIQKHWRGSLAREYYLCSRASAIMIQACVRGTFHRSKVGFMHSLNEDGTEMKNTEQGNVVPQPVAHRVSSGEESAVLDQYEPSRRVEAIEETRMVDSANLRDRVIGSSIADAQMESDGEAEVQQIVKSGDSFGKEKKRMGQDMPSPAKAVQEVPSEDAGNCTSPRDRILFEAAIQSRTEDVPSQSEVDPELQIVAQAGESIGKELTMSHQDDPASSTRVVKDLSDIGKRLALPDQDEAQRAKAVQDQCLVSVVGSADTLDSCMIDGSIGGSMEHALRETEAKPQHFAHPFGNVQKKSVVPDKDAALNAAVVQDQPLVDVGDSTDRQDSISSEGAITRNTDHTLRESELEAEPQHGAQPVQSIVEESAMSDWDEHLRAQAIQDLSSANNDGDLADLVDPIVVGGAIGKNMEHAQRESEIEGEPQSFAQRVAIIQKQSSSPDLDESLSAKAVKDQPLVNVVDSPYDHTSVQGLAAKAVHQDLPSVDSGDSAYPHDPIFSEGAFARSTDHALAESGIEAEPQRVAQPVQSIGEELAASDWDEPLRANEIRGPPSAAVGDSDNPGTPIIIDGSVGKSTELAIHESGIEAEPQHIGQQMQSEPLTGEAGKDLRLVDIGDSADALDLSFIGGAVGKSMDHALRESEIEADHDTVSRSMDNVEHARRDPKVQYERQHFVRPGPRDSSTLETIVGSGTGHVTRDSIVEAKPLHVGQTGGDIGSEYDTPDCSDLSAIRVLHALLNRSATRIQSAWRGAASRRTRFNPNVQHLSTMGISQDFSTRRSAIDTAMSWSSFDIQHRSAIGIQALFRGYMTRRRCTNVAIALSSPSSLRSHTRGYAPVHIQNTAHAARLIQRMWRRRSLRLALMQRSMEVTLAFELQQSSQYHAAVMLQGYFRSRMAVARYTNHRNSCIMIQSCIRRWQCSKRSHTLISSTILLQKQWRGSLSRRQFENLRRSVVLMQSFFRMARVFRDYWFLRLPGRKLSILDDAARTIQVTFFLWKMKLAVWQMQSSAIILQRSIRGQLARSAARFALVHMNASFRNSAILSFARVVAGNDPEYAPTAIAWGDAVSQAELSACVVVQSAARRMLARRRVLREFSIVFGPDLCMDQSRIEEEDASAIVIQRAYRRKVVVHGGWRARKAFGAFLHEQYSKEQLRIVDEDSFSPVMQSRNAYVASFDHRTQEKMSDGQRLEDEHSSAAVIQRAYRRNAMARAYSKHAIKVQSLFRGWEARRAFGAFADRRDLELHLSATVIQKAYRKRALLRASYSQSQSALRIQSLYRGWQSRRAYRTLWEIREREKMANERRTIEDQHSCAAVIQRAYRRRAMTSACSSKQALKIQSLYRGWEARTYGATMDCQEQEKYLAAVNAAVVIQTRARGLLSRANASTRRTEDAEKARLASLHLLEKVDRSSRSTARQLLSASEGDGDVGPCIRRLAGRVRTARRDAKFEAEKALKIKAFNIQGYDVARRIKEDLLVNRSQHCPAARPPVFNGIPVLQLEEMNVSTPIRRNTTPLKEKTKEDALSPESHDDASHSGGSLAHVTNSSKTKRLIGPSDLKEEPARGLAMQARELLFMGRRFKNSKSGTQTTVSSSAPLKGELGDERKSGSIAGEGLVFGDDSENMPSPIKKEPDWDWANEW